MGQPLIVGWDGSSSNLKYSLAPLVSDQCQQIDIRVNGTDVNCYSINHMFGGNRFQHKGSNYGHVPVDWGSLTGKGEANYGMEDGSVRQISGVGQSTYGTLMKAGKGGSTNYDAPNVPREWADK
jgi:hypothetical protein